MFKRQSLEEAGEKRLEKERRRAEGQAAAEANRVAKEQQAFANSPAGQARAAFGRGDHVFQYAVDVANTQAIVVAMAGATNARTSSDPSEILNSVSREGWKLVNGSFVFVEMGSVSRDKFMSSGQNVAVRGTTVGYYLFRRSEANRVVTTE